MKARIPQALEFAVQVLTEWGYAPVARKPGEKVDLLASSSLEMDPYERDGRLRRKPAEWAMNALWCVPPATHAIP